MKKILIGIFSLLILLAVFFGAEVISENPHIVPSPVEEAPVSGNEARVRGPEEVTLAVGETKEAAGLTITLNDFLQDFRCGADELCMEAGGVAVNVTLDTGTSVITRSMSSDEADFEFEGFAISIPRAAPARYGGREIPKEEYEVTFMVRPLLLDSVEEYPEI